MSSAIGAAGQRAIEHSTIQYFVSSWIRNTDSGCTFGLKVLAPIFQMLLGAARHFRCLGRACFILACATTAADANPQLGYPIVVNNIPLTTQYVAEPAAACQLAALYPQYIIIGFYDYDVHLPLKFNGVEVRPNGSLICYVADATRVAYEINITSPDCVSGYALQRGVCTKDPSRGPPNSHAPAPQNNPDPCTTDPSVGNPISLSGSSKSEDAVDFVSGGARPLGLVRHYRSRGTPGQRLGTARWHFDFEYEILVGNTVAVFSPDGVEYDFNQPTPGVYASAYSDSKVSLTSFDNGGTKLFSFKDENDRTVIFIQSGNTYWPKSITERNGLSKDIIANTAVHPTRIDSIGFADSRHIDFRYETSASGTPLHVSTATFYTYAQSTGPTEYFKIDYGYTNGNLTTVTRSEKNNGVWQQLDVTTYHYENTTFPDLLTGVTDARGVRYATWTYDPDGRPISSSHAGGADLTTVVYDDAAVTRTVTNALGKQATYSFAKREGTMKSAGVAGQATTNCPASARSVSYNTLGQVSQVADDEGRVTAYTRDSYGRPTSIVRGSGTAAATTTGFVYDNTFNVVAQQVEPGLTTTYTWSTAGQLSQVTQTDTTSQTAPYSTNGQTRTWTFNYTGTLLSSVDGPLPGPGDTVSFSYDANGYPASYTNEIGQVTIINSVNYRGQPTLVTDPNGVTTSLTYDALGRLLTVTVDPSGLAATMSLTYNAVGDVTRVTRANGAYLSYTYDDARRVVQIQDNTGASISLTRDAMGNVTARQINGSDGTIQLAQTAAFDELGRLLKFIGASKQTWVHGYDKTNNRVSITDPRSNVFGWSFDSLNRLINSRGEEGNSETVTLDGRDEVTSYSDPRSLNTTFVRNGFGDVIQRTSPDTGTTTYVYDAAGRPTQMTDGRGVVTNLTYDAAGRLLSKQYPAAPGENVTFSWDGTSGGNKGVGRLTRIDDASGSIEWTFNSLGQAIQEKKTTAGIVYLVGYAYDLDGNLTRITYPSGRIVNYYRGATGLVNTVTQQPGAATAEALLAKWVTYQPFGPLQSLSYGNDLILWKTFTQDYNLSTFVVEQGSNSVINRAYTYWYDDFDITNVWDNNVAGRTDNYVFTPSHRLQNVYGDWGTQTYWQDPVGNRTGDVFTNGTTTTTRVLGYPYNSNLYVGTTEGTNTLRSVTNDGAGNIVTDVRGTTTYNYRYNNRNRLDQLTIGTTVTASYVYDGLERMAVRTTQNMTPSTTTHYIYDSSGRLLAEAGANGTTQREYVWLDDTPLALFADLDTATPKQWYVHPDHLDRPSKMTDASQTVVWDAWYWPYGEVRSITGTASNNLRYPGQYFLVESGLQYNWHRHYDASIGRYTQADPLGLVAGPSLYVYAGGNPVSFTDPTGEFAWGLAFAAADIGLQLYENGGNWRCINLGEVGLSLVGGGLAGALEKGAFRFKDFGSHTWDATRKWMNREGIQLLGEGQVRHHWLLERNQGIGRMVPDWIKNQPWNTNPISASLNSTLAQYPELAWVAGPGWSKSLTIGAILAGTSPRGGGCDCR
ncbi:RHS repeat-associated core domain-containing protein [Bradyrhizobium sp. SZCCHNRI2007]|uniref:RHS repeat-associated core domain-containing protein n=1 Tax=Bradyrhizobium sp. SZCCHNRI2007 TaxID=3057281 RepID=UPI0028E3877C|nr:RHS repeat-associated core domain-containing protein [Bradyrhizobium sp. SZCCHNRI2007]